MSKVQKFTNLTSKQQKFVDVFSGNVTAAATTAGYKQPHIVGKKVLQNKHVIAALKAKQAQRDRIESEVIRSTVAQVLITRNDIINRLDTLSKTAESESAKVSALLGLADIFLLRVKNVRDINKFHGWTADELEQYAITGTVPERFRSVVGSGGSPETSLRTEKV